MSNSLFSKVVVRQQQKRAQGWSRLSGFYKLSIAERLQLLADKHVITEADMQQLAQGKQLLQPEAADKMIENVIGVFGLPLALGLNFVVNEREYAVPMAVEEPSIVAALSSAARLIRDAGGFDVSSTAPILVGQIQIVDTPHPSKAQHALLQHKEEILNLANSLHPNMVARGGGALDIETFMHPCHASQRGNMVVLHLLVDTRDAMGANFVNSMCEGIAPYIEKITKGKVFLRILSNLTDRALVRASVTIPTSLLAGKGYTGEQVRDGIVLANDFALSDPYRAATHNKGIMNGIDPVAIVTGNDWRALEAAAHAYAARNGRYSALTQWYTNAQGHLVGVLEMPMKVGTVGGNLQSNPAVQWAHRMLQIESSRELAELMGAVGLAQNFSALRALATDGIQRGHMTLHARSVAMTAQAPPELFDKVVELLVESGDIKVWKAQEIIASLQSRSTKHVANCVSDEELQGCSVGHGKVLLLGEHAVVYGKHAIAAPIQLAVKAKVLPSVESGVRIVIPAWGVNDRLKQPHEHPNSLQSSMHVILSKLGLQHQQLSLHVYPHVPRAMGLGGSAALAVAVIRALSDYFKLNLTDDEVNSVAYESEKVAHGTPSGIDNAIATYGRFMMYRRGDVPKVEPLYVPKPISIVIGNSGVESLTAKMVAQVERSYKQHRSMYERIFNEIDTLALEGKQAIEKYDLETLGQLMNVNQGLLNAMGVSSWELEELIQIARQNGALGAKLTGAGGGGSMIAICPENSEKIAQAMRDAGYEAWVASIGGTV